MLILSAKYTSDFMQKVFVMHRGHKTKTAASHNDEFLFTGEDSKQQLAAWTTFILCTGWKADPLQYGFVGQVGMRQRLRVHQPCASA